MSYANFSRWPHSQPTRTPCQAKNHTRSHFICVPWFSRSVQEPPQVYSHEITLQMSFEPIRSTNPLWLSSVLIKQTPDDHKWGGGAIASPVAPVVLLEPFWKHRTQLWAKKQKQKRFFAPRAEGDCCACVCFRADIVMKFCLQHI